MINKEKMKALHTALLKNFIVLIELVEKAGVRYTISGGTAVGAVREGGFLPWDDDIDIIIHEDDYDKYLEAIENSEKLSSRNYYGKKGVPFEKAYGDELIWIGKCKDKIFIDVFKGYKLRKLSKIKIARLFMYASIIIHKNLRIRDNMKINGRFKGLWFSLIKLLPMTTPWARRRYDKIISKSKIVDKTKYSYYYTSSSFFEGQVYDLDNTENIIFEGVEVKISKDIINLLKPAFGDISKQPKVIPSVTDHGIELI